MFRLSVLGALLTALLVTPVARFASRSLLRMATSVGESLRCNVAPDVNLLIVRSSGDEASAALSFSQFLAWAIGRVSRAVEIVLFPFLWFFRRLDARIPWMSTFLLILCCYGAILSMVVIVLTDALSFGLSPETYVRPTQPLYQRILGTMFSGVGAMFSEPSIEHGLDGLFMIGALLGIVLVGVIGLVCPALLLLSIVLLPFGPEAVLAVMLTEISVESVPVGTWTVHQYARPASWQGGLLHLAHSAAYDDQRVISLIASWMKDGHPVTRRPTQGQQ